MRKRNYTEYNNVVDVMYDLRPNIEKAMKEKDMSIARVIGYIAAVGSIIGCLVGALAGLGLSFTVLSPFSYRWSGWCCISGFASICSYRSTLLLSQ
jgi:hypothetical protein